MLCVTRTPLRVSLFGGGTDYPAYFERSPGAVVGFAINRYVYLAALETGPATAYRYRLAYSIIEQTQTIEDIQHPIVREVLRHYGVDQPLDISIMADLPAGSGLGSSSAFTVGCTNLIANLMDRPRSRIELAETAIFVEQSLLGENVGVQDQLHTAMGGVNRFDFGRGRRIQATPIRLSPESQARLNASMVLIGTGLQRKASDVAAQTIEAIEQRRSDADLARLYDLVGDCVEVLRAGGDMVADLGAMLDEGWRVKRRLAAGISNPLVDDLYDRARRAGAHGGKLCGAGGGGFLMMLIDPDRLRALEQAVAPHPVIPIQIDAQGTTVVSSAEARMDRRRRDALAGPAVEAV